jgi:hypothetical protein
LRRCSCNQLKYSASIHNTLWTLPESGKPHTIARIDWRHIATAIINDSQWQAALIVKEKHNAMYHKRSHMRSMIQERQAAHPISKSTWRHAASSANQRAVLKCAARLRRQVPRLSQDLLRCLQDLLETINHAIKHIHKRMKHTSGKPHKPIHERSTQAASRTSQSSNEAHERQAAQANRRTKHTSGKPHKPIHGRSTQAASRTSWHN